MRLRGQKHIGLNLVLRLTRILQESFTNLNVSLLRLVPSVAQVTTISGILLGLDVTSINLLQLQLLMHWLLVGWTIVTRS